MIETIKLTLYNLIYSKELIYILIRLVVIAVVTKVTVYVVKHIGKSRSNQNLVYKFLENIIITVIYLAGILFAIGQIPELNKVTQTILAGSGILALAISLSAQESLNNIISGLFIILFKPFEVGDRITLVNNSITGTVEDITLRHTVIKTFINSRIVIPNSTINKEVIENSNLIDTKASSFVDIFIAYEADIHRAMEIMADTIGSHPLYVDTRSDDEKETTPLVKVYVRELADSGVGLRASMWTKTVGENFSACSDVRLELLEKFKVEGIEIPYNKMDILIKK